MVLWGDFASPREFARRQAPGMGGEQATKGGEARRLGERSKAIDGGDFVHVSRDVPFGAQSRPELSRFYNICL